MSGREPLALLAVGALALVVSGIGPNDRATWMLEVAPAVIAAPVLIATARRLPLTPLAYRLIFVHALILMVGGHYTYAKVPAGFWVQDALDLARNPYDRLGHLAQGFVPAIVVREILVRRSPLQPGKWWYRVRGINLALPAGARAMAWSKRQPLVVAKPTFSVVTK